MSLPIRSAIGILLATLSATLLFAPEVGPWERSTIGTALMAVSLLIFPQATPQVSDDRPPILWRDRDPGQQFSIIMFHVVMLGFVGFMAFQIANVFEGLLGIVLAAAILCAGVWLTVRNWKNRNAR